jgi:Family of unknown function (DUF6941)
MFGINAMLADAAQVVAGKLFVLGGGWSRIIPGAPFAVFGKIDIPWHVRQDQHTLRLELVDTDGAPFMLPGSQPLVFTFLFDPAVVGDGIKPGTSIDWPFAATVGPGLPLAPSTRYEWRIVINDDVSESGTLPFQTTPDVGLMAA